MILEPDKDLAPSIALYDAAYLSNPTPAPIGIATAGPGRAAIIQTVSTVGPDTAPYVVTVTGLAGTNGSYSLGIVINAASEDEAHDGVSNDSIASAQNIDGSFLLLTGTAERGAVVGYTESVLGSSTTYSSTDVGQTIRSPKTITSALHVPDSLTLGDVNVVLDISHTYNWDLDAFLISPSGTRVELFTKVGRNGDNFSDTHLDDEASIPITLGSAPFNGSFQPSGSLSDLDGEDAQGAWTLEITDTGRQDNGRLNAWSLELAEAQLTSDYYALTLQEGQHTTVVLSTGSSGGVELRLQNADGTTLATGGDTGGNAQAAIDDFVATATASYFVQVLSNTDYGLVVTRDAAYDFEDNDDFASSQDVSGSGTVLGSMHSKYVVTEADTWLNSEATAVALGGHLVTINDQAEQDLLYDLFGTDAFRIGFTDQEVEGQWEWISGEPVTYTNWQLGEPNDAGGNEDYSRMDYRGWNDNDGVTYLLPAIVEINDHDVYRLALKRRRRVASRYIHTW